MTTSVTNSIRSRRFPAHEIAALLLVLFSFFMSALVSDRVFERLPHLEDEVAYLFQAKTYAGGHLVIDTPNPRRAYWQPFVLDQNGVRFGKYTPGWPLILAPGADPRDVQLGQTSRTPRGTKDGIRVSLPPKTVTLADPHSGGNMWWSNNDQDWADVRITRDISVPAGSDLRFWMWNNYVIEDRWDYGFVEVSPDGGTAYVSSHTDTFFSSIDLKTFEFKKFAGAEGSNGIAIGKPIKK